MLTYLTNHAMKNIWAAPRQDTQCIIRPHRVNGPYGVLNKLTLHWEDLVLPERKVRFHVYQIGQLSPQLLGLFDTKDKWKRLDEAMMETNMIVDLYTEKGVMIPRFTTWYRWTEGRNLVLAVRENKIIPWNMQEEEIFMKVYSGAYFNTLRLNKQLDVIHATGRVFNVSEDLQYITNWHRQYVDRPGHLFIWVNGILRDVLNPSLLTEGDLVEFVHDTTIFKKVSLKLTSLRTFDSTLDNKGKYLITYNSANTNEIEFYDDIDFYVKHKDPDNANKNKAVYYHRNRPDSVRQLTHRDYSLVVPYVLGYREDHDFFEESTEKVYIDFFVRKSGFDRPLIDVHNRIRELYKLSFTNRVNAMLGVRSNVKVWRAEVLEASGYTQVMSSEEVVEDEEQIVEAYGYNGLAKALGDTPVLRKDFDTNTAATRVFLPNQLQLYSTIYEYDANGKLLNFNNHVNGCYHAVRDPKTNLVEVLSGYSTEQINDYYSQADIPIYADMEYRVYRVPKGKETTPSAWEDITKRNFHAVVDNKIVWTTDLSEDYTTLVRSDRNFLAYELQVAPTQGIYTFNLVQRALLNGRVSHVNMMVPLGTLDIWLNGHALVEGIDYFVQFPRVVVINKKYLERPTQSTTTKQKFTIRYYGFCNEDLSRIQSKQVGYVNHNTLSRNKRYDLKDDKVLHIKVAGQVVHREEVFGFSEDNTYIKNKTRFPEGSPYEIKDIVVPLRALSKYDTYELRAKSEEVDRSIEAYMTQFVKDKVFPQPEKITALYPLYSPLMAYLVAMCYRKTLNFPKLKEHYDDNDILDYVKQFEWLIPFDPLLSENKHYVDLEYVVVHPNFHNYVLDLTPYHYKFLENVNRVYFKNKLILNHHLRIGEYDGS